MAEDLRGYTSERSDVPAPKGVDVETKVEEKQVEAAVVESQEAEQVVEAQESQYSPLEVEMMEQGWQPLDKWEGDPKDHRSAREFKDRGELLTRIKSQNQELKQIRENLNTLSEHNKKVYQAGYEKAIVDLQKQRREAQAEGDFDTVDALNDKIADAKAVVREIQKAPQQAVQPGPSPVFQEWLKNNDWYQKDVAMRHWANAMAIEKAQKDGVADEDAIYDYLNKEVRKMFPDKFQKRVAPPSPDNGSRQAPQKPGTKGGQSFEALLNTMDEDSARAAKHLVKSGVITKEKYVEDYKALQGKGDR